MPDFGSPLTGWQSLTPSAAQPAAPAPATSPPLPTDPPPGAASPSVFLSGAPPQFQRAPRAYVEAPHDELEIVAPPPAPPASYSPSWLLAFSIIGVLGSLIGGGTYAFMAAQNPQAGQFAWLPMLSMLMMLGGVGGIVQQMLEPRRIKREQTRREQIYRAYLEERRALLEQRQQAHQAASLTSNPPLAECIARVEQRDRRLWERTLVRDLGRDFLDLRLGVGRVPASFRIKPPLAPQFAIDPDPLIVAAQDLSERHQRVDDVAITLPLTRVGAAGLAGSRERLQAVTRALLLHLATHHAPSEVKLVLTFPELEQTAWEWARWLPHTWSDDRTRRFVASTPERARALLVDLAGVLKQRQLQRQSTNDPSQPPPAPLLVFVFADPALLSGSEAASLGPLLQMLLNEGPGLGAYSLFLADRVEAIRKECGAVVDLIHNTLRLVGPPPLELEFAPDTVDAVKAEGFARTMAPLRLPTLSGTNELPRTLTLLDMLGVRRVDDLSVQRLWQDSKPFLSLAAPIGVRAGGDLVMLDFHERKHGPHGLGAGTTGSGKSELLQTLVASLAIHFHPHEVAFVLIDYKGGGMAAPFRDLPHQIGSITNLEAHLVPRAINSLAVENRRRQRLFDIAGVKNIDEYQQQVRAGRVREPLPHLLVIADEFAELAQHQRDLMDRLISVARIGRSLGVHLLLATQKPAGVVNEQIWSNTNFRLCLRVADPSDSQELLKRPDAAQIPNGLPGRGYFQVGMNEVFELFQAAYSGTPYLATGVAVALASGVAEVALDGLRRPFGVSSSASSGVGAQSQLHAVVAYLRDTAQRTGIIPLPSLWLPPLPEQLALDTIRETVSGWDGQSWRSPQSWMNPTIGLLDDPEQRAQRPLRLDLGASGHLLVYGAPGSGKTMLLQTLICSLALEHSPDDVNIYVLDFGGRMLRMFERLPHVGGVILPDDSERVVRLTRMLLRELELRKDLLSHAGISTRAAYHAQVAGAPPALVLVLDNYTEFANAFPEQADMLARVAREGGSLGVHLVITAATVNTIPARLASNVALAVALELNDPGEYPIIVGRAAGLMPERGVRGRGLVRDTSPLEFQTALPMAGQTDVARRTELQQMIQAMLRAWTGTKAREVRVLPDKIELATLLSPTATWLQDVSITLDVTLGLDADTMDPMTVDLTEHVSFLISGPPASGKSWLLQTWLVALAEQHGPKRVQFFLSGIAGTALLPLQRLPHTRTYFETDQALGELLDELISEVEQRRQSLDLARRRAGGLLDERQFLVDYPALILVIDDFDQFRSSTDDFTRSKIETLVKRGRGLGFHLLLAGPTGDMASTWDPLGKMVREAQVGFLLGTTNSNDLALLNIRLPMEEQGKSMVAGRGYLARRGRFRSLQMATAQIGTPALIAWIDHICGKT